MDSNIVNFIRDRFNSLEINMANGFEEVKDKMVEGLGRHEKRIRSLEDTRLEHKTKLVAYGSIGGGVFTLVIWVVGKIL